MTFPDLLLTFAVVAAIVVVFHSAKDRDDA